MSEENGASSINWTRVITSFIGLLGIVATAYFTYIGVVEPRRIAIEATQTAEAKLTAEAIAAASTPTQQATATTATTIADTPTPTNTATPTLTPTPKLTQTLPSPEQAVREYWEYIINGEYEKSWAMLSPAFKNRQHPNGIATYVDWADSVQEAQVTFAQTTSLGNSDAVVKTNITFRMKNGDVENYTNFHFDLILNQDNNGWLINKTYRQ